MLGRGIALSAVASKLVGNPRFSIGVPEFEVFGADPGYLKREKELVLANQKLTADLERLQERSLDSKDALKLWSKA